MDLRLGGKTVLITGGSKGIGSACARSFAAEGCNLILVARNLAVLEKTQADIIAKHGAEVTVHAADLRDPAGLKETAGLCSEADILVNNAGDIPAGTIESLDEAKWRHAWELKVFAYINLSRDAYAWMKQRGSGVIVNIIGIFGERPSYDYLCGSTANAGLTAFTKALGVESAKFGVRVMGVNPPSTRTERVDIVRRVAARQRYGDENRTADLVKDGEFLPAIDPEQVADAVVYIASPRASQISGIVVNLG